MNAHTDRTRVYDTLHHLIREAGTKELGAELNWEVSNDHPIDAKMLWRRLETLRRTERDLAAENCDVTPAQRAAIEILARHFKRGDEG